MDLEKSSDIEIIMASGQSHCGKCNAALASDAMIFKPDQGPGVCLTCAGFDHLIFLPSGNVALTTRSRKLSPSSAVVVKWSKTRRRYERQGVLVSQEALTQAGIDCAADANKREVQRQRAAKRREKEEKEYINRFANRLRELYPNMPSGRELEIAEHACEKGSGRIGRTNDAKQLSEEKLLLAVIAHIRHRETPYDQLLIDDYFKEDAREMVKEQVTATLHDWGPSAPVSMS